MVATRKFFVGGNFKMNGSRDGIKAIVSTLNDAKLNPEVEVVVSPPSLYLTYTRDLLRKDIGVAAQNVFNKGQGAFTGEVAADQVKDAGADWVILGHSERRTILKESDEFVASKTKAALDGGLSVILCIGESLEEREKGITVEVVTRQLAAVAEVVKDWSKIVVAYEPIWAIGTGKVASTQQAQDAHDAIRKWIAEKLGKETAEKTRILYGGSVTDKNSKELATQPDVDGFLVGGASLKPAFIDIINSA